MTSQEIQKVLEPRDLDTISVNTNYLSYGPIKNNYTKSRRKKSGSQSMMAQQNQSLTTQNILKFDKSIYNPIRTNFKKNTLIRDQPYIVQFGVQKKRLKQKSDLESFDGERQKDETDKKSTKKTMNRTASDAQIVTGSSKADPKTKYQNKLRQFLNYRESSIQKGIKQYQSLTKSLNSQDKFNLFKNDIAARPLDMVSTEPIKNPNPDIQDQLELIQKKINVLRENQQKCVHDNTSQNQNQEDLLVTKKDLQQLLKDFPEFDVNQLDEQNIDYIAHILNLCECFKCECNTCKCNYSMNTQKPRYNFYDLTSTNQAKNHALQNENVYDNLPTKINYDCPFPKEFDITKNTTYMFDFKGKQPVRQDPVKKTKIPFAPHIFQSTYQSAFPKWFRADRENLKNLQQINIQKNKFQTKSLYQDSFSHKDYIPEPAVPRKANIDKRKQPFVYVTTNQDTYQGEYNKKALDYNLRHTVQKNSPTSNNYMSIYNTLANDSNKEKEKPCPKKMHQNKSLLKQQIAEVLQV